MASNAQLKFQYYDALRKGYNENLGHIKKDAAAQAFSSDTAVRTAFLENIDQSCRAIAALTTNTYNGSFLTFTIDINEELVGE